MMGTKHFKNDDIRVEHKTRVIPVPVTRLRTELRDYLNSFTPKTGDEFEAHKDADDTRSMKAWADAIRRACLAEGWFVYTRNYGDRFTKVRLVGRV